VSRDGTSSGAPWQIWVDTGGTFTDCLGQSPDGALHRAKVLSTSAVRGTVVSGQGARLRVTPQWTGPGELVTGFGFRLIGGPTSATVVRFDPEEGSLRLDRGVAAPAGTPFELLSPEEAPVLAARILTGTPAGEPLPPIRMRLATTRATNALLERKGSPTAFFVTAGFGDLLAIGTQQRPRLFELGIRRPAPLYSAVVEVVERRSVGGDLLVPLDEVRLRADARRILGNGIRAAAVALLHAVRDPRHERRVAEVLLEEGFEHVSISSALSAGANHRDRSETAVVNAYLAARLDDYVDRVAAALPGGSAGSLHLMTSAGGLVGRAEYQPRDSLLSGPAGGVVGARAAASGAGLRAVIAFDMGGTSTDVSRVGEDFEYVWQHRVGDAHLLAPALAIHTIAAGGGSICSYRDGVLSVGPESAGADPGPACYGAGGPLTITDCNLLLGRIVPERFGIPLDAAASEAALARLAERIANATGERPDRDALLAGLIDAADERMADAARAVSIRRGFDPAEHALVVFGGAGPQHACAIAERLGIRSVLMPRDAGLLSAWGLGRARIERIAERRVQRVLPREGTGEVAWLRELLDELAAEALAGLLGEGVPADRARVRRRIADVRFVGQDETVPVDLDEPPRPVAAFLEAYDSIFGHCPAEREIEVESLRVIASDLDGAAVPAEAAASIDPGTVTRTWVDGTWREVLCVSRSGLPAGRAVAGPALILDEHTSLLLPGGWSATALGDGSVMATAVPGERPHASSDPPEVVRQLLFTSRFEAIVGEMGEQLRRTAVSTNVKERLDYSCALLDAEGRLVANAPHIPVHLGALGLCVRSVAAELDLAPGDVVVTNHPNYGGSHLPDVTVITPIHLGDHRIGYVASRAHHAEIGGTRPGSMPPAARTLAEEGVVIPPIRLVQRGTERWDEIESTLRSGPYPTRALSDNLADLRAQVAANRRGAELLRRLAERHGGNVVQERMRGLADLAARRAGEAIRRLPDGRYEARESMDDGAEIVLAIEVGGARATFDFTGSAPVHRGNLNATPAIVHSAVLYVLRLLIDENLPLNEGLLKPVEVVLPRSFLSPSFEGEPGDLPAVVGGNTEVSQRLVDTILKALHLAACSQGTMNNVLWGSDRFGYYETIGGGEGGTPAEAGATAVHTHMTNTRITDVEVLEHRYPVRVDAFTIRRGSGGQGRHPGGDGIRREITFLAPLTLSVLTQHRVVRPYGLAGGAPGATGRQWLVRADGAVLDLSSVDGAEVSAGDRLVVETPGGGGWGPPASGPVIPPDQPRRPAW
jgi:5-oxoprolinase (ATP-hydrolysing)